MRNKKGQLDLGAAPGIVMVVGLLFLVMATMALIGEKYGSALETSTGTTSVIVSNETDAYINETGYTLKGASDFKAESFVITEAINTTSNSTIGLGNISVSSAGVVTNATELTFDTVWISYGYNYFDRTTAYNATADLQTELSNNTSIAGIVLTISLVGIVLSILVGVFVGMKKPRI